MMERSGGKDLNDFTDQSSGSFSDAALFDAAQYTFLGKGVVDEVELGGFEDEDEDESAPGVEGRLGGEDELNEYHLFDKDEGSGLGPLSDIDDLATTFAKISGQLKSLQIVAILTAERDGDTRKAALNTLAIGYKILGDDIWRYVGKLTEAQRSMLDDRFKWKAREMEKRKEGRPGEARTALRHSVRDNALDLMWLQATVVMFINRCLDGIFCLSNLCLDQIPLCLWLLSSGEAGRS